MERKSVSQVTKPQTTSSIFNLENVVHEARVPPTHNLTRDQAINYLKKLKERY